MLVRSVVGGWRVVGEGSGGEGQGVCGRGGVGGAVWRRGTEVGLRVKGFGVSVAAVGCNSSRWVLFPLHLIHRSKGIKEDEKPKSKKAFTELDAVELEPSGNGRACSRDRFPPPRAALNHGHKRV